MFLFSGIRTCSHNMENIKKWGKELGFLALTVGEFRCLMRNPYFSKMFVSLYRERERERERRNW
jgi:hypothetical protein